MLYLDLKRVFSVFFRIIFRRKKVCLLNQLWKKNVQNITLIWWDQLQWQLQTDILIKSYQNKNNICPRGPIKNTDKTLTMAFMNCRTGLDRRLSNARSLSAGKGWMSCVWYFFMRSGFFSFRIKLYFFGFFLKLKKVAKK